MKFSKLRLAGVSILVIFIILLSGVFFFIERGESNLSFFKDDQVISPYNPRFPVGRQLSTVIWERENVFINDDLVLSQGSGYEIKNHNEIPTSVNPNPVKILLFGDSYTWGNGSIDRYSTFPQMLQDKLDKEVGENIFEITTLARNGASTYDYYDYFKVNDVKKLNPDLIIYDYFNNDSDPSFTESLICRSAGMEECLTTKGAKFNPEYQACIHGEGSIESRVLGFFKFKLPNTVKSMLDRYCQPIFDRVSKDTYNSPEAVKHPLESPYFPTWQKATQLLSDLFGKIPHAVADLKDPSIEKSVEDTMMGVLNKAGFDIIPMDKTEPFMYDGTKGADYFNTTMFINPGNTHSGSNINHLYAQDTLAYILKTIPAQKIALSKQSVSPKPITDLVRFTLPTFALTNNSISPSESNLVFNKGSVTPYKQETTSNRDIPFQYNNCSNLNASNFLFTLDKRIKKGSISLSGLPTNEEVAVGFYYYDQDYRMQYLPAVKYTSGQNLKLPNTSLSVSVVLVFPQHSVGCPFDKVIDAPDFNINLKYLP